MTTAAERRKNAKAALGLGLFGLFGRHHGKGYKYFFKLNILI